MRIFQSKPICGKRPRAASAKHYRECVTCVRRPSAPARPHPTMQGMPVSAARAPCSPERTAVCQAGRDHIADNLNCTVLSQAERKTCNRCLSKHAFHQRLALPNTLEFYTSCPRWLQNIRSSGTWLAASSL